MKLLYLYIENYRCIKDQEFNFDSNYRFRLERNNPEKWELFGVKVENPLPEDFWASSIGKHKVVESVSAIVGENGSGKTSIANFIGDYIGYYGNENKKFFVIFKHATDKRPQYWTNIKNVEIKCEIDLIDVKKYPSKKYQRIIYFSPFFTTEHMFNLNRTIDISTSNLLSNTNVSKKSNSSIKLEEHLANYKSKEYEKVLSFLAEYHDMPEKQKNNKISISLPQPRGSRITLEIEKAKEEYDFLINKIIQRAYFIFLVCIGMICFFWSYNGIKGRQRDRRTLLC